MQRAESLAKWILFGNFYNFSARSMPSYVPSDSTTQNNTLANFFLIHVEAILLDNY